MQGGAEPPETSASDALAAGQQHPAWASERAPAHAWTEADAGPTAAGESWNGQQHSPAYYSERQPAPEASDGWGAVGHSGGGHAHVAWEESAADGVSQSAEVWAERFDEATAQSYWYNARTDESSWTAPIYDQGVGEGEGEGEGAGEGEGEGESFGAVAGAGQDWQAMTDEEGNAYWWNARTGETSWDAPAQDASNAGYNIIL